VRKLSEFIQPNQKVSLLRRRLAHAVRFIERPNYPAIDTKSLLDSFFPDLNLVPQSVCLDIGANEGYVSLILGQSGATVIGFEPNPWAAARAVRRVRNHNSVHIVVAAVGERGGVRNLFFPSEYSKAPELHSGSASIMRRNSSISASSSIQVWTVSMSEVLDQHDEIEFLKIDAEGAESELWPAIEKNMEKIRFLAVETHGRLFEGEEQDWLLEAKRFIAVNALEDRWRLDWP